MAGSCRSSFGCSCRSSQSAFFLCPRLHRPAHPTLLTGTGARDPVGRRSSSATSRITRSAARSVARCSLFEAVQNRRIVCLMWSSISPLARWHRGMSRPLGIRQGTSGTSSSQSRTGRSILHATHAWRSCATVCTGVGCASREPTWSRRAREPAGTWATESCSGLRATPSDTFEFSTHKDIAVPSRSQPTIASSTSAPQTAGAKSVQS